MNLRCLTADLRMIVNALCAVKECIDDIKIAKVVLRLTKK